MNLRDEQCNVVFQRIVTERQHLRAAFLLQIRHAVHVFLCTSFRKERKAEKSSTEQQERDAPPSMVSLRKSYSSESRNPCLSANCYREIIQSVLSMSQVSLVTKHTKKFPSAVIELNIK